MKKEETKYTIIMVDEFNRIEIFESGLDYEDAWRICRAYQWHYFDPDTYTSYDLDFVTDEEAGTNDQTA